MNYEFGNTLFATSDELIKAIAYWHLYGDDGPTAIADEEIERVINRCLEMWEECNTKYDAHPNWTDEEKRGALNNLISEHNAECMKK